MDRSEEVELDFEWDGLVLVGTLHLPSGPGPHPAVVMAHGSGPADRDSGGFFRPIRQMFVDRGVATFAFDKPGCGQSSGDWTDYALQGRAEQLIAALALVRNHQEVSSERVGIWGHSQGGWLVQLLAGRRERLAFAIANSAPTIGVAEQILYDCEQTLRRLGLARTEIRDALVLTRSLHNSAANGDDFEAIVDQLLEPASLQPWYDSYPSLDDAKDWHHFKMLVTDPHQPVSALKGVACPLLIIYGGLDALLPPWRGVEESGLALAAAATSDASVVAFPLGDHRIQQPGTKDFVDGYLDLLGAWTAARVH